MYNQTHPRKTLSLCQTLHVPHDPVCMSGYMCPFPCVCVCLHVPLSSVCISCPRVFVNTHTSVCAYISVYTPGVVCIHFSPHVPRSMSVSLCVQVCLSTYGFAHRCRCAVVLVQICAQRAYIRVGKFFLERAREQIISALQATWCLFQLLNYAIVAQKQPQTMSK